MSNNTTHTPEEHAGVDLNVDPYGSLGLLRHPDGTVSRTSEAPFLPACSDPKNSLVLTKDVTIDEATNTWARIFLPRTARDSSDITKLPLFVDFHGGGFVVASAGSAIFQDFYTAVATSSGISSIIVSVDYRRAPEHRLPTAYDDCVKGLYWIRDTDEEWLIKYADFGKCFLMGSSAGGNIAYHVGLRVAKSVEDDDLKPLHIRGMILDQPFFGGINRTGSETKLVNDEVLPLRVTDLMWELSLPVGADRDHEYCNPVIIISKEIDRIKRLQWKVLVVGCSGDPLSDRQIELVGMLREKGVDVVGEFEEGGHHGLEVMNPEKAKAFALLVKQVCFMS